MADILKIENFIKEIGMHPELINVEYEAEKYAVEMKLGLETEGVSSLPMIPSFASSMKGSELRGRAAVLDAGGTNLRAALVEFNGNGPEILEFKKIEVPGRHGPIPYTEYVRVLSELIHPYFKKADALGYCFSFPATCLPGGDAVIQLFNKELQIEGAEGAYCCRSIFGALGEAKSCAVVNDSTSAMFAVPALTDSSFETSAGCILGTGFNVCYAEKCENITKNREASAMKGFMGINVEAAAYDKLPRGKGDLIMDSTTANPGDHQLEKMISGAYLGNLVTAVYGLAAEEGLFTEEGARIIAAHGPFETIDIGSITEGSFVTDLSSDDLAVLTEIAKLITTRAGKVVSVPLLAANIRVGCDGPLTVLAEGSTINKFRLLNSVVKSNIAGKAELVVKEDATIYGTAAAALTRFMSSH